MNHQTLQRTLLNMPSNLSLSILFGVLLILTAPQYLLAQAIERDERTWRNPTGTQTFTFSTPQDYIACPEPDTTDTIIASGIGDGWQLHGEVTMTYLNGDNRIDVPNGRLPIDYTATQADDTFSFSITYPPIEEWYRDSDNHRGIYIDLAIEVTDANGIIVDWVGGDPIKSPGTLGPGGQDWGINCLYPAPPTYLPLIGRQ